MSDNSRLHSLDAMRGMAAFCVLFYHWEHMLYVYGTEKLILGKLQLPLPGHSLAFFLHGDRAVDIFFVISGFVFYWLYSMKIADKSISAVRFSVLRISRLYPLHWLTIVIVIGLSAIYAHNHELFFDIRPYSVSQIIQGVVGVSSWLRPMQVLNEPFWSVSVELLLYLIFFILCRFFSTSWWAALLLAGLGLTIRHININLMRGVVGYFLGGAAYYVFHWLSTRERARLYLYGMGLLTVLGWVALLTLGSVLKKELQSDLVFAVTIIFIALLERRLPSFCTRLSWMGDISYSVYLIHYPLQIAMVVVNNALGGDMGSFHHAWSFPLFVAIVIPLGFLSYHCFEMPVQRFLRDQFEARRPRPTPSDQTLLDCG